MRAHFPTWLLPVALPTAGTPDPIADFITDFPIAGANFTADCSTVDTALQPTASPQPTAGNFATDFPTTNSPTAFPTGDIIDISTYTPPYIAYTSIASPFTALLSTSRLPPRSALHLKDIGSFFEEPLRSAQDAVWINDKKLYIRLREVQFLQCIGLRVSAGGRHLEYSGLDVGATIMGLSIESPGVRTLLGDVLCPTEKSAKLTIAIKHLPHHTQMVLAFPAEAKVYTALSYHYH